MMRCPILCLAIAAPIGVVAQRAEPITVARVRALAREAEAEGKGDKSEIVLALDRKFRQRWGEFESFPVSILRREDLSLLLSTPYMTYRRALAEYLRMGDPLANIPWVPTAVVSVSPAQIGSPDIIKIIVERDGKAVAPLETRLKPMSFANGSGQTAIIHAGEVRFPMSAFAPGASVTVTAVPASGASFVFTFDADLLQTLK